MIKKVAGDYSDLVDIMLSAGFRLEHGSKHYKYFPPPYKDKNGDFRYPVYLDIEGSDPKSIGKPIFITLSVSMEGRNRNEVLSWKRVFKALDNYPHMVKIFGKLPSEVFNEWSGTPQKKKKQSDDNVIFSEEEEVSTILNKDFKILPVWCTDVKPYLNDYLALKEDFSKKEEEFNKATSNLNIAKIKGYPTKLNEEKVESLSVLLEKANYKLSLLSNKISDIAGDKKLFPTAEEAVSFIQKRLEKGYDYSVVSLATLNEFIIYLPLLDFSLVENNESVYNELCDMLGIKSCTDDVKENIDGTVKNLVNSKRLIVENNIVKISNLKLDILLRKLGTALSSINKIAKKKERTPTNKALWSRAKAEAKKKYDVFPCVPVNDSYALSRTGWKLFSQLKIGDEIVSYNRKEDCLEWDTVKYLHFYANAETMRMYKANTAFNFVCTDSHKWVIRNKNRISDKKYKYEDQLVSAKDITKNMRLITSARMKDSSDISLGGFRKKEWSWVEKVLSMSNAQREAWFAAAIIYDGHEIGYSNSTKRMSYGFSQKDHDHRDAVIICAALLGYNASFGKKSSNPEITSCTFSDKRIHNTQNVLKERWKNCDVWCPETNNGTWLMKQGRMVTITGNSAYAVGYALQWYKKHGGGWSGKKKL